MAIHISYEAAELVDHKISICPRWHGTHMVDPIIGKYVVERKGPQTPDTSVCAPNKILENILIEMVMFI